MDRSIIDQYVNGGALLRDAYRGLTCEHLFAFPIPNTWSLHQIAIHMLESDLIGSDRMKRIACMDKPLLMSYDDNAFSNLPGSDQIDTAEAIELFAKNRQFTALILRALPDSSYDRFGIHSEKGKVTLAEVLTGYVTHLEGHLQWVHKKRELLGVPL